MSKESFVPKLQVKANELVDVDAGFVSLVKRGANRIPFRITKEDTESMLDLHKIGRRLFAKTEATPAIVAALVQKRADINQVAAIFKEAGLDPQQFVKSEKDGIVTVAKADYAKAEDAAVMKVSDDVALVISGVKKSFDSYAYSSTEFNTIMSTEGVYPSMCVAKDALGTVVGNILYRAATPAEAADLVAAAIDDFKTFMVGLLGAVPVTAFKADVAFDKAKGKKTPAAEAEDAKDGGTDDAEEDENGKLKAKKEDDVPAASDEAPVTDAAIDDVVTAADNAIPDAGQEAVEPAEFAAPVADGPAAADEVQKGGDADIGKKGKAKAVPKEVSGAGAATAAGQEKELSDVSKGEDPVLRLLAEMKKSLDGLSSSVTEVRSEVGAISERVDQVDARVQKTDAALNGTVFNEAGGDNVTPIQKADAGAPPLLDTGYARRA
jgi:hypothetical protein